MTQFKGTPGPWFGDSGSDGDIIAYRLHQSDKSEHACDDAVEANDEADLNECIGQDVDIPKWNGEGLPPAGCECEARYRNADEWVFFRCVGVDSGVAFGWLGKEAVTLGRGSYEFRPLRTAAERKREAAAKEMARHANSDPHRKFNAGLRNCLSIYDAIAAGKIPGVKLED